MRPSWSSLSDEVAPVTVAVVGLVMVLIPEPATSALGAGLLLLGVAWWVYEWNRP